MIETWHLNNASRWVRRDRPDIVPSAGVVDHGELVPFAADSPWNQTLTQLYPGGIPISMTNDTIIGNIQQPTLMNGTDNTSVGPHLYWTADVSQFTMAIYVVDASTPLRTVAYNGIRGESSDSSTVRFSGGGTLANVPIPDNIKPAPPAPSGGLNPDGGGGDSQIILWDPTGAVIPGGGWYDFWQCAQDANGYWATNASGQYICRNMSRFTGGMTTDGVPSNTPNPYVSRGAGVPYMAGLIRKWEIDQGHIDHALAMAFDWPSSTFVYPASKSDGSSSADITQHLPEGGRIKLKDSFPIEQLSSPVARIVATAMRDYGMICIDSSGRPKIYAEADVSAGTGANWNNTWMTDLMRQIPLSEFIAIDPNGTSSLRETNVRIDSTKPNDPLASTPSVLQTESAGHATLGTISTTTPVLNVQSDELVIVGVSMRGNNSQYVTGMSGCGVTWKRLDRRWTVYAQNLVHEIWWGRVPAGAPTEGVTVSTSSNVSVMNVQAHRLTAGSAVRQFFANDTGYPASFSVAGSTTVSPSCTLSSTTANSLTLGFLTTRNNPTVTAGAGETAVRLSDSRGSGGSIISSSTIAKPTTGAATIKPTLSSAQEFILTAVEIT